MGLFDSLFGDSNAGQDAANKYLEQAMQTIKQYMGPYADMGMGVAPGLLGEYDKLMTDPAAMLEFFMSGYEPSKEYQFKQDYMGQAAANSAAAGGMRGSPLDQYNQQDITRGLLDADMQKYLGNVTGLYGQGLTGNQGIFNTGYDASSKMSSDLSNIFGTQSTLAYNSEQQKIKNLMSMLGMGLGAATGLGTSFMNNTNKQVG